MKRASITEAKNNLSALIDGLKGGSSLVIVDRGRPVARLQSLGLDGIGADERLASLVRDGIVRPGKGVTPEAILDEPPPHPRPGGSALRALLDERRDGR